MLKLIPPFSIFTFYILIGIAQPVSSSKNQTIQQKKQEHKILLIPFDPKLYISEVDRSINKETKMTFNQVRYAFRKGLDGVLANQFKTKYSVVSLMNDTGKTSKDLNAIYYAIDYKYDLVPTNGNLLPPKEKEKPKSEIIDGKINTQMQGDEKRFMNTTITNASLLTQLNKKYKTDIFVFINELDIKATTEFDAATGAYQRDVAVHYSVFDKNGILQCAGLSETRFPSSVNIPNKISSTYFTALAQTIFNNFQKAVSVPDK